MAEINILKCICGKNAIIVTSWTSRNLGRRSFCEIFISRYEFFLFQRRVTYENGKARGIAGYGCGFFM